MIQDWLHKREDAITLLVSYLRQAALLILSKIAKGLFAFFFYGHPIIFPTLMLVSIHLMNISNSGIGKCCVIHKIWYNS